MTALLALSPILVILVLMIGARWSAARAGIAGLLVALAAALLGFGYGDRVPGGLGPAPAVGGALLEAVFVAATILWIIFPALCIHELQTRTGAIDVLRRALARLSADPRIVAVLVAWFFALFMEGAAGFGTPVALAAPILVGMGFGPVQAVAMALIGHAAGVSFGAVGTPVLPQMAATGFAALELARAAGVLHAALGWILLLFMLRVAARGAPPAPGPGVWAWVALAAVLFLAPYAAIAGFVGPELPTLGGALLGGVGFVAALRLFGGRSAAAVRPVAGNPVGEEGVPALLRAALPYLVLLGLILVTRLVPPLQAALMGVEWAWALGPFAGAVRPLYHPGTMLLLGFVLGGLGRGHGARALGGAMARAAARLVPVVVALLAMLALSRVMVHAGMIEALAVAAAATLGGAWPLVAPLVGVLGTFVTGSATASNILFTEFQEATAAALALPVLKLVGAQNFGAAVGNIVCPHNIVAGGATVGIAGREGDVLRDTVLPCAAYAAAGGLLLYLMVAA